MKGRVVTGALALLVLLGLVAVPAPAPAATVRSAPYATGAPDPVAAATVMWATNTDLGVQCAAHPLLPGLGGACFDVPTGLRSVGVTVVDASRRRVSGNLWFEDAGGAPLVGPAPFCRQARVDVPPGAVRVVVAVDTTVIRCGLAHGGPATTGWISLQP